ncbi:MAG: hypothetical protein JNK64_39175 [Myxococcales bacterium]|nr:hypothetical protein [Myxococcales bacterium]
MIELRPPRPADAPGIWRLAPTQGPDRDSPYAFVLLCTHFADTGVVASLDGAIVGYALGYRPPAYPRDMFVWQFGTAIGAPEDLGVRLLEELLTRPACAEVRFLCMTRGPRDLPLRDLLAAVSRRCGVGLREEPCFSHTLFARPHADEVLCRVGPLR